MSLLTQSDIEELKAIYRRTYGRDLADNEAWAMGNRLVRLFAVLLRLPIPRDNEEVRTASDLTR